MNDLISIIVPVYNVEKYIRRCLDSLLCQSYHNLEIILIDDGSPDMSGAICDEYANKDKRIKVIHKENGGVSSARNSGLDIAQGDYIGFVDPDDYVSADMYEFLYSQMTDSQSDIVQCNFLQTDSSGNEKRFFDHIKDREISGNIEINRAFLNNEIRYSVWNKLFSRKTLEGVRFRKDLRIAEDKLFVNDCINNAQKIKICDRYCYYYFVSDSSVIHSGITEKKFDDIKVLDILYDKYKESPKLLADYNTHASVVVLDVLMSVLSGGRFKEKLPELIKRTRALKKTIMSGNFPKFQKVFVGMLFVAPRTGCKLAEIYFSKKRRS